MNEFLAPFQGIKNAREAHGNRAAAELAVEICTEFPEPPKRAGRRPLRNRRRRRPPPRSTKQRMRIGTSKPATARPNNPYFAHLAMCRDDKGDLMPVQPPLGWVLSKATQDAFDQLLTECGNDVELAQLETALGKPMPQQSAHQ